MGVLPGIPPFSCCTASQTPFLHPSVPNATRYLVCTESLCAKNSSVSHLVCQETVIFVLKNNTGWVCAQQSQLRGRPLLSRVRKSSS